MNISDAETSYNVVCDITHSPAIDLLAAQVKLESAFCLNKGDADNLFNGTEVFSRIVENKSIAMLYQAFFSTIGLACQIKAIKEETSAITVPFYPNNLLVSTRSLIDRNFSSLQLKTFLSFLTKKFFLTSSPTYTHRQKTSTFMTAAILLYLASGFYLLHFLLVANLLTIFPENILYPAIFLFLFLSSLLLSAACLLLAKTKGYSSVFLIIGLLGPIGLGFTLLVPDRYNKSQFSFFNRKNLPSYLLMIIGIMGLYSIITTLPHNHVTTLEKPTLESRRSVYPSTKIDDVQRLLEQELIALHDYLDSNMNKLKENAEQAQFAYEISDAMFNEVTQLVQWLYYQRFLARHTNKNPHNGIGEDLIRLQSRVILRKIQTAATRLGNTYVKEKIEQWFMPHLAPTNNQLQRLYSELIDMKLDVQRSGKIINQYFLPDKSMLNELKNAHATITGNLITIQLQSTSAQIHNKTLIIACYSRAYKRRTITGYDIVLEHVGGTLPNYLLPGHLNYFSRLSNHFSIDSESETPIVQLESLRTNHEHNNFDQYSLFLQRWSTGYR